MHNAGPKGDELKKLSIPFKPLDRQLHADDSVRLHRCGFSTHPAHRQLSRVIHRLRKYIELLILAPAAVLNTNMVDARADTQPDRFEPGFSHQQEFIDRKIGGEDAGRMRRGTESP